MCIGGKCLHFTAVWSLEVLHRCRLNDNDGKTQWEDPTWMTTDGAIRHHAGGTSVACGTRNAFVRREKTASLRMI